MTLDQIYLVGTSLSRNRMWSLNKSTLAVRELSGLKFDSRQGIFSVSQSTPMR